MVLNSCASRSARRWRNDFETALVGAADRNGQALRKQIVAGVAGGDLDLVGFTAEADDIVGENTSVFAIKSYA